MKRLYEVLRQKETEIDRLKEELQALRIAAPLLEEELAPEVHAASTSVRSYPTVLEEELAAEAQVILPPVRSYRTAQAKPARAVLAAETRTVWP